MSEIREPVTHNLKIWPEHYSAVCAGVKRAELRKNDRDYRAGDTIDLCEWDKDDESFTGEFISVTVTHVADVGEWMPGYVLLSIERALRDRAEPVAWMKRNIREAENWDDVDPEFVKSPEGWMSDYIPLYTAPPAPVVADDRESFEKFFGNGTTPGLDLVPPWFQEMIKDAFWEVWKGSRAAMLQPVSAPYKLPGKEGWIPCSELLPEVGDEIFYYCEDDGIRDCGIVSSSNFTGRGDAELFVHAEGYDLRFGADITHWMPLPEAPAKN